jgi:hypothetical protein
LDVSTSFKDDEVTYGEKAFALIVRSNSASGEALTKNLTYTSSDENVVKVSDTGEVTIVGSGTSNVTVNLAETDNYESASESICITVLKSEGNITVKNAAATVTYGDEFSMDSLYSFVEIPDVFEFSSSNDNVVTFDREGNIQIVGAGSATVTLSAGETANYKKCTETFKIKVEQAEPNLSVEEAVIEVAYGDTDKSIKTTYDGDSDITYEISEADKKVATVDENGNITTVGVGTATITVKLAETTNYKADSREITIKVAEANIGDCDISLIPKNGYTYDGNEKKPSVVVSFADKSLTKDSDYEVSYSDNKNAGTATVTITGKGNFTGTATVEFTIQKAEEAPDKPETEITPEHTMKTVADVDLPDNWNWSEADKTKELEDNKPVKAIAEYKGEDAGNYKTESVEITITRRPCEHKSGKTEVTNKKSATCTETGYTGDTVCSECGTVLEVGTEIQATGHTGGTATCAGGAVCKYCGIEYTGKNEENHTGNTEVANKKAATCTETGYTGDTVCADCKKVLTAGTEIPVIAHSYKSEVTKEATTKEEGIITYTCEFCGDTYTESIEKKIAEPPYIAGDDGEHGWDVIRAKTSEVIDELVTNSGESKTVNVIMNGADTVPGDIFTQIKGQDVTIVFDMGDGIKWSVDGKTVVNDNIEDINFRVYTGTDANTIPDDIMADVINNVTGESYTMNLTLAYDGEFGFTAVMNIGLDEKNAGYYANLFYYNKTDNKLDFMSADKIAEDGTANLTFTHASDYTIIIDEVSLAPALPSSDITTPVDGTTPVDNTQNEDATLKENNVTSNESNEATATNGSKAPKTGDMTFAALVVWLMVLSEVCVIGCVMIRRRRS